MKKINKEKALTFIAEYINYDMQSKDRLSEVEWLLKQVYGEVSLDHLTDDWNLDDTEQWGDSIKEIYEK